MPMRLGAVERKPREEPPPSMVEAEIDRDALAPRHERAPFRMIGVQAPVDLDKHILRDLLGASAVAQDQEGHAKHPDVVAPVQRGK